MRLLVIGGYNETLVIRHSTFVGITPISSWFLSEWKFGLESTLDLSLQFVDFRMYLYIGNDLFGRQFRRCNSRTKGKNTRLFWLETQKRRSSRTAAPTSGAARRGEGESSAILTRDLRGPSAHAPVKIGRVQKKGAQQSDFSRLRKHDCLS